MSLKREIERILRVVAQQGGFTVTRNPNTCHWRVTAADGSWVTVPSTPSERRGVANVRAKLRRLGAKL